MFEIVLVIFTSIVSKVMGLLRELSLAYSYGTSSLSDVYLISITITTAITGFITPAINAAYIPYSNRIEKTKSYESMAEYTRSLLFWLFICSLLVVIISEIFPKQLVHLFANGFTEEQINICSIFVRFTMVAVFPLLLISVVSGYLQNHNRAILVAIVPIVENIVIVLSIILSKNQSVILLPIGYMIGGIVAFVPLMVGARCSGFSFFGSVSLISQDLIFTIKRMIPVIVGASATQINTVVDRALASRMGEGSISVLYYSDRIVGLIIGIVVLAPLTIIFPKMSKIIIEKGENEFYQIVNELYILLTCICLFGTICLFFYNKTFVKLIFAHGAFQKDSISYTGMVLGVYSLGLVGYALREYVTRVYYSENNYKVPFYNSLISVGVNIILDFILGKRYGVVGLALATTLAAYVAVIVMAVLRRHKEGVLMTTKKVVCTFFIILPAVIFWAMCFIFEKSENIVVDIIEIIIGMALFLLFAAIFKPCDIKIIRKIMKND